MIIALMGKIGSGKDAVGNILTQHRGFMRVSFADPLKQCLLALNPLVDGVLLHRVADLVTTQGWDAAKKHPEVRSLLQRIGTEMGRKILGETVWIDLALAKMSDPYKRYVVTDCRFLNEAQAVRREGAELWRIERPGAGLSGAQGQHASEMEMEAITPTRVISNTGTLDDLQAQVLSLVS